jgi:hypothetical protein
LLLASLIHLWSATAHRLVLVPLTVLSHWYFLPLTLLAFKTLHLLRHYRTSQFRRYTPTTFSRPLSLARRYKACPCAGIDRNPTLLAVKFC